MRRAKKLDVNVELESEETQVAPLDLVYGDFWSLIGISRHQLDGDFVRQRCHPTLSHAEVIRRALQLYEFVIEEEEKGGGLSIKTVEGGEVVYRSIF